MTTAFVNGQVLTDQDLKARWAWNAIASRSQL